MTDPVKTDRIYNQQSEVKNEGESSLLFRKYKICRLEQTRHFFW